MINPSTNRRLQLATRLHYALMRELGTGVDVGRLLKHPLYARDVLLVCDACTGHDLPRLAKALRGAMQDLPPAPGEPTGLSSLGASSFGASQASMPAEDWPESLHTA